VRSPSHLSTAALSDDAGRFPQGRATAVTVTLPRGSVFERGFLYFRPGGAAAYDSTALAVTEASPGEFLPTDTIPAAVMGPRGAEYWVRVQTATRTLSDPPCAPGDTGCAPIGGAPRVVRTDVESLAESAAHAGQRYRMI